MKILFLSLLLLAVTSCDQAGNGGNADPTRHLTIVTKDGKRQVFDIELALTPQQQQHGLMNRTEMDADHGMLFYFGTEAPRSFWMKNTLIPLDMVFIRKDGTIANIHDSAIPNDLSSVASEGPVSAVLELNGGTAKKLGIVAGSKARHPFFGN